MLKNNIDVVIIGGGIIGLATANEILRTKKNINILVLEKSSVVASQQSGHFFQAEDGIRDGMM